MDIVKTRRCQRNEAGKRRSEDGNKRIFRRRPYLMSVKIVLLRYKDGAA